MRDIVIFLLLTVIVCCHARSSKAIGGDTARHFHKNKSNKKFRSPNKIHKKIKTEENGQKRSLLTNYDNEFPLSKRQDLVKEFTEVVKKVFGSNIDDSEFEIVNSSLTDVLVVENKNSKGNLFKQMDKKMGISPSTTFEAATKIDKETINKITSNAKPLTKQDWEQIKDIKMNFLPQEQTEEVYSKDYFPTLSTYLIAFVATTVDMIYKGKVSPCELSRELDLLKYDAETAIQALIYKRLSMLEPERSSWSYISGNDRMNWNDKYLDKMLCKGNGCILQNGQGENPVEKSIEEVGDTVLEDAKEMFDVFDSILEMATTEGKLCFKGCDCPESNEAKIQRLKYMTDFPWSCLGDMKDSNKKKACVLPCGKYNENYEWCPVKLKTRNSDWDYCTPSDWRSCTRGWY